MLKRRLLRIIGGVVFAILIFSTVWFFAGGSEYCCSQLYLRRQNQIQILADQQQQLSIALSNYYTGKGDYATTADLIKQVQQTQHNINYINWQINIVEKI